MQYILDSGFSHVLLLGGVLLGQMLH